MKNTKLTFEKEETEARKEFESKRKGTKEKKNGQVMMTAKMMSAENIWPRNEVKRTSNFIERNEKSRKREDIAFI